MVTVLSRQQLKVEIGGLRLEGYDDSNLLVLPSKKRKTKVKVQDGAPVGKLLSKKQRKHLEKILDQKKKKLKVCSLCIGLGKDFSLKLTIFLLVQHIILFIFYGINHCVSQGFMQDKIIASHVTHVLVDTWMLTLKC